MNPLTHWNQSRLNQLNELDELQHKLRNVVRRSRTSRRQDQARLAQWIPLVEVSEDARGYVIKAELPQVKKEDVRITLENGTLIITGAREFDQNSKKDRPLALAYGRFAHSFVVPNDARPARVTTVFKNGVLISTFDQEREGPNPTTEGESFSGGLPRSRQRRGLVTFSHRACPFFRNPRNKQRMNSK